MVTLSWVRYQTVMSNKCVVRSNVAKLKIDKGSSQRIVPPETDTKKGISYFIDFGRPTFGVWTLLLGGLAAPAAVAVSSNVITKQEIASDTLLEPRPSERKRSHRVSYLDLSSSTFLASTIVLPYLEDIIGK